MFGRRRRRQKEFDRLWGGLVLYNAEIARGIVHTPEWDQRMRFMQRDYNDWARGRRGERD